MENDTTENLIHGIDVSRWQGTNIDWDKVKADGFLFAFVKATDGSAYKRQFIDMEITQANNAKNAGLKIGFYHFAHPNSFGGLDKDAEDEANYFLKTLEEFPKPDLPLVFDFEDEKMVLTQKDTVQWINTFRAIINNAGFELMMYSYKSYLDQMLPADHKFGDMPLWLARYPKIFDITKFPENPIGWNSWEIWQYSQQGIVNGIAANTDLNLMTPEFYGKY